MRALEQQSIVRLTYAGRERAREKNRIQERDATAVTYFALRSTVHTVQHYRPGHTTYSLHTHHTC